MRNNLVKKKVLAKLSCNIKYMTYFLHHYVNKFESNVDLAFIAGNEMNKRSLLVLCKYVYDNDKYLAFSSRSRYNIFLRKINKATEELYEETLYELLCFYSAGLVVVLFFCLVSLLMW